MNPSPSRCGLDGLPQDYTHHFCPVYLNEIFGVAAST